MSNAIFEAVTGLDIVLPSGRILHAKPLPWRVAMGFQGRFANGRETGEPYATTLLAIVGELSEAVGLQSGDLDELDLGQLDELTARFFHLQKNGASPPTAPPSA